ncbi:MAG: signal recognition particle-docking protein FtsY [Clostridia bacterium]|nr:signal recognition particle-docking protein FtsY [Clostridiales bacterium]MDD7165219.1 signal recognition particle-docking protein FtsY [Clostridia bacterium]MDY2900732.1 signal recognition particle-docking protein FtsY [Christensenellaceae bacterium]
MGFFGKLFGALKKTKEGLGNKLRQLFSRDKIGDDFYEDLEDVLISSDISVTTADEIVENLHDRMIEERESDKDKVLQALKDEIYACLDNAGEFELEYPAVIMVIGVNGVGKTTSIGKMAHLFTSQKKTVTIAAADTFRAAAADQLEIWAERAKVRIVKSVEGSDPSAVVFDALSSVKAKKTDVLIIDTAGRLHTKSNLMEELKKMSRVVEREYPEAHFYKLIALDATTGQNALSQVEVFNEAVGIDGIILTKLDGTAKGGFVVSLCNELCVPVAFVGTGEKIEDVDTFDKESFVDAIFD